MSKKELEKAFANPENTKAITLDLNEISQEITTIFEQLAKLQALKNITLVGEVEEIPEQIGLLKQIKSLTVRVLEGGARLMPESLGEMISLEKLIIERNFMQELPSSIGKLQNLKKISINQTNLNSIPESIEQLTMLESLDVTESNLMVIPDCLGKLTKLRTLALSGDFTKIPESLGEILQLESIYLSGRFTSIPLSFKKLAQLFEIYTYGRFEKVDIDQSKDKNIILSEALSELIETFNANSNIKFNQYKQEVPWKIVEDPREFLQRPLRDIPVLNSFKTAALPGEKILLYPSTKQNIAAVSAFSDGLPLLLVSDLENDPKNSVEGFCKVGVLAEKIAADEGTQFQGKQRVKVLSIRRGAELNCADIDDIQENHTDSEDLVKQLLPLILDKQERNLASIKTPKKRREQAAVDLKAKISRAIKENLTSFLFGAAIELGYEDRQKLLLLEDEIQRLNLIKLKLQ